MSRSGIVTPELGGVIPATPAPGDLVLVLLDDHLAVERIGERLAAGVPVTSHHPDR